MIDRRHHAAPWVATVLLTTLLSSVLALSPFSTAGRVQAAPPEHRVYMVTDSVGLGAKNAVPAAFPAGWQVTVDGTPALFVEQLESKHKFRGMPMTMSDFLMTTAVMRPIHHLFEAPLSVSA